MVTIVTQLLCHMLLLVPAQVDSLQMEMNTTVAQYSDVNKTFFKTKSLCIIKCFNVLMSFTD